MVTLPTPTELFDALSTWSSPMFNNLLGIALLVAGLFVGVYVLRFLLQSILSVLTINRANAEFLNWRDHSTIARYMREHPGKRL